MTTQLVRLHLEWEPRDLWIGVFWKRIPLWPSGHAVHLWLCLVPTLPMHVVVWYGAEP